MAQRRRRGGNRVQRKPGIFARLYGVVQVLSLPALIATFLISSGWVDAEKLTNHITAAAGVEIRRVEATPPPLTATPIPTPTQKPFNPLTDAGAVTIYYPETSPATGRVAAHGKITEVWQNDDASYGVTLINADDGETVTFEYLPWRIPVDEPCTFYTAAWWAK